jgi:hypothetical protein
VTLSRKGAKSRTQGRKLRSTGTKAGARVGRILEPRAELEKKLAEALERQVATSEVLRVISSSPSQLQPVFDTILANATRICGAMFGMLNLYDGHSFRTVAFHNAPPRYVEARSAPFRPHPESGVGYVERTNKLLTLRIFAPGGLISKATQRLSPLPISPMPAPSSSSQC